MDAWKKKGGMTSWMACIAAAGTLESRESETTPPIIAQLCMSLLACHLNLAGLGGGGGGGFTFKGGPPLKAIVKRSSVLL